MEAKAFPRRLSQNAFAIPSVTGTYHDRKSARSVYGDAVRIVERRRRPGAICVPVGGATRKGRHTTACYVYAAQKGVACFRLETGVPVVGCQWWVGSFVIFRSAYALLSQ